MIFSCTSNKGVYWCGDHPCINKKEREAYFKKTMVVEIRELKKDDLKKNSHIEEIQLQAQYDENIRIKNENKMAKQLQLDEKNRIKEEKALVKQLELDEKIQNKKNVTEIKKNLTVKKVELSKFRELVDKIIIKNSLKPYPDINDIPIYYEN